MTILVIAEHDNATLKPSTLHTLGAAKQIGGEVHVLVAGQGAQGVAQAASQVPGVAKVLLADSPVYKDQLAENLAALVTGLAKDYGHVLAPATTFGKNFMPRVAALLDVGQVSDISAVKSPDTFVRPIYAGNALATVQSKDPIKVVTVRSTGFDAVPATGGSAPIEPVPGRRRYRPLQPGGARDHQERAAGADRGAGHRFRRPRNGIGRELQDPGADRRQAERGDGGEPGGGGRGVRAERLAGGADGQDRGARTSTSRSASPGAIQHLAGMKDSRVIVAINKDEEAPIFQVADYGIVGDLFKIVPELATELG